jgi:hypothetical protein
MCRAWVVIITLSYWHMSSDLVVYILYFCCCNWGACRCVDVLTWLFPCVGIVERGHLLMVYDWFRRWVSYCILQGFHGIDLWSRLYWELRCSTLPMPFGCGNSRSWWWFEIKGPLQWYHDLVWSSWIRRRAAVLAKMHWKAVQGE